MSYDPIKLGADCHRCFLYNRREGGPVPPEINHGATAMIVAEAPGRVECEYGRPLIGDTGQELQRNISALGYRRADFSYSNALLCRPPGNELGLLLHHWKKENQERKKRYGKEGMLPHPFACCRPRLLRELVDFDNIITLGASPIQSLLGTEQYSISALRGGPIEGFISEKSFERDEAFIDDTYKPVKVLPTFHPSFVLRQRKWTKTLRIDLGRAMRWFQGRLNWREPKIFIRPPVEQVKRFLEASPRFFSWDLETTMDDPLVAQIFCFGVGMKLDDGIRRAIVVPFHSKEYGVVEGKWGHPSFYTDDEFEELVRLFRWWLVDPKKQKVGHNSIIFDTTVVKSRFGIVPKPQHDTLPIHRAVESELPHTLGFIGTSITDVTAWKADKSGTEAKTDLELHRYNGIDCVVTHDVVEPLVEAVKLRDQQQVVKNDYKFLLDACVGMHRLGMRVNTKRRDYYDKYFLYEAVKWRNIIRQIAGIASFNPGSVEQVKEVLFDTWGLPPVEISDTTGEPSTGDDCLRTYRIKYNLTRVQRQFIEALRKYRNAVKMRGTDVVKYRRFDEDMPPDDFWEDTEETEEEYEYRRTKDLKKKGILLADGRVHASWNQLTTSGRGNCTDPNMQNKRRKFRDMYEPEPDCKYCKEPHVFVAADMDQLELRFGANRWNLTRYKEVLLSGRDPHAETSLAAMGAEAAATLARAEAWAREFAGRKAKDFADWKRIRDFAKRFYYACQYAAEDPTVYDVLTSVEDDDGNLVYADLDMQTVRERRANLLDANPEFQSGWDWEVKTWRRQGFLCEPVWGRRRDFLNGEELNEIVNFPIQCVPGHSRVLTERGYVPISELVGFKFKAWTGKKWAEATAVAKGTAELFATRTDRGVTFYGDASHNLRIAGRTAYEWRSLSEMVDAPQNARVALDLARPLEFGEEADVEDAYHLGLWLAEGSSTRESEYDVALRFAQNDRAVLERVVAWAESRGMNARRDYNLPCGNVTIYVGGESWLRNWGADPDWRSYTKRVPERVWRVSLAARKSFLRGFLDGDGHANDKNGFVAINLCQRRLLEELWLLFRTVGVNGGGIFGPNKADAKGHVSYRMTLSSDQTFEQLGFGRAAKLRTRELAPWWEARRVINTLVPTCQADRVIKSRIARHPKGRGTTSPYVLARMGANDVHDLARVTSCSTRRVLVPVYTLVVNDEEHAYVVEGFISKNSGGRAVVMNALFAALDAIPYDKWCPYTGLVHDGHDSEMFEVPLSKGEWAKNVLNECMQQKVPGHEVPYTAEAKVGINKDPKKGEVGRRSWADVS